MTEDLETLYGEYSELEIRDKTQLLRSGSDLIYAVNELDRSLATAYELSECCEDNNSNAGDISNAFRTLERLYGAEYEHSNDGVIIWNLDKLREEQTLEELDKMLSPGAEGF